MEGGAVRTEGTWVGVYMLIPPLTLETGPHPPFPSCIPAAPAAVPAPSGPPTVTDYSRNPGDRGGNIWILLQGLAGGLEAGVLRQT